MNRRDPRHEFIACALAACVFVGALTSAIAQPAGGLWASATPLEGEALTLPQSLDLGRPARAVALRLVPGNDGRSPALLARGRGTPARLELPSDPSSAVVRSLTLEDGSKVAVVTVELTGDTRTSIWSARAGRPWLVWQGRTALRGDLGERHADAVRALLRADGSTAGLVVGDVLEPVRVCGRAPALLHAQALTSARGLSPVRLLRVGPQTPIQEMTAEVVNDAAPRSPALSALHFHAASGASVSTGSGLRNVEAATAPHPVALSDGDESTGWRPADGASSAFVSAHLLDPSLHIESVELSLGLPDATPAAEIRSLWLVDETHALHVRIPAGARRVRIVPAQPLTGPCLSVLLDQTSSPRGAGPPALTELRAFTELDHLEGRRALLGDLAEGGDRRARAVRLLAALGRPALQVLARTFADMPPGEQRAALRIARLRLNDTQEAIALLLLGARGEDPEVADFAVEQLAAGLPRSAEALGQAILGGGEAGVRAATLLARGAPDVALPILLSQLDTAGAEPTFRRALARAAADASASASSLDRFLDGAPSAHALAYAAQAIAGRVQSPASERMIRAARAGAQEFSDRYRIALAMAQLPSDVEGDAWLAQQVRSAEEWMMRYAALAALRERHSPTLVDTANAALEDEYPRVRATAARMLEGQEAALVPLATMARRDSWPRARAAAVTALTPDPRARRILRAALEDPAQRVRAVAARALGITHDTASVPALISRLEASHEWPAVLSASIGALGAMCVSNARPALLALIERSRRPEAWEPDMEVAVAAIAGLGLLGDAGSLNALRQLVNDADPALAQAARQALATGSRCGGAR